MKSNDHPRTYILYYILEPTYLHIYISTYLHTYILEPTYLLLSYILHIYILREPTTYYHGMVWYYCFQIWTLTTICTYTRTHLSIWRPTYAQQGEVGIHS